MHRSQVGLVKMEAVGNHELHAVLLRSGDHFFALFFVQSHWLLTPRKFTLVTTRRQLGVLH
jgi:hypothetical protein